MRPASGLIVHLPRGRPTARSGRMHLHLPCTAASLLPSSPSPTQLACLKASLIKVLINAHAQHASVGWGPRQVFGKRRGLDKKRSRRVTTFDG